MPFIKIHQNYFLYANNLCLQIFRRPVSTVSALDIQYIESPTRRYTEMPGHMCR